MSFQVKSSSDDEFAILEMSGSMTLSPALVSLRETARKLFGHNKPKGLILQVAEVTNTDSAGLGELTIVYTYATQNACPLRTVGASVALRKMFEMTRLEDLFQPVDSVETAKKEMRP